ncbi:MAG: DUF4304 domain-containing protein [Candidatus Izemoplasmatales bacterium]
MEKREFKKIISDVLKTKGFERLGKIIYKDYGLFILKVQFYKSNYSNEYYFHTYVNFKNRNQNLKDTLEKYDMYYGSRLMSEDKTIYSFDYVLLSEQEFYDSFSHIIVNLDKKINNSPLKYLQSMDEKQFNESGKLFFREITDN